MEITWAVVAQLVIKYGVPFADQLITNLQNQKPVDAATWAALKSKIDVPFAVLVPKQP